MSIFICPVYKIFGPEFYPDVLIIFSSAVDESHILNEITPKNEMEECK